MRKAKSENPSRVNMFEVSVSQNHHLEYSLQKRTLDLRDKHNRYLRDRCVHSGVCPCKRDSGDDRPVLLQFRYSPRQCDKPFGSINNADASKLFRTIGYFYLDTRQFSNGVHTIASSV